MSTETTLVKRRYAEMRHAAIAYAITRINDFTNGGQDLTPHERDALQTLIDNQATEDA